MRSEVILDTRKTRTSMRVRTYSELLRIPTFMERYEYLRLSGEVGASTFGYDRWMNQDFYRSYEWKRMRDYVIARDVGMDLAVDGFEIHSRIIIHHMNPMTVDDIEFADPRNLDPEFLITTTHRTHNAIHYGDANQLPKPHVERRPGDTQLWGSNASRKERTW